MQKKLIIKFNMLNIFFNKLNNLLLFNLLLLVNYNNDNNFKKNCHFIFIHGTFGYRNILNFNFDWRNIKNSFKKAFEIGSSIKTFRKQIYSEEIKKIENNRWSINNLDYDYIMSSEKGIVKININKENNNNNNNLSKSTINSIKIINREMIKNFKDFDLNYYIYNWSGALLEQKRKEESVDLFKAINELKMKDEIEKKESVFIICGYSHGGNLALNLGDIINLNNAKDDFKVDYLILIGTPIYNFTKKMIMAKNKNNNYVFENIINIFSSGDKTQISDIISAGKYLGTRRIISEKRENLFQFSISYYKNLIDNKNINPNLKNKINSKNFYFPNHKELFYFKNNSFYEVFPIVLLLPYYIRFVDNLKFKKEKNNRFESFYENDNFYFMLKKKIGRVKNIYEKIESIKLDNFFEKYYEKCKCK